MGIFASDGPSQRKPCMLVASGIDLQQVLSFLDWKQRAEALVLSKEVRQNLGPAASSTTEGDNAYYWRFLCERLGEEHNLHVPRSSSNETMPPLGVAPSWRSLFLELYAMRRRLDGTEQAGVSSDAAEQTEADEETHKKERFAIMVAARFRAAVGNQAEEEQQAVVLPLHQKVQIIRDKYGCNRKEAMEMIVQQRGWKGTSSPSSNEEEDEDGEENRGASTSASSKSEAPAAPSEEDDEEVDGFAVEDEQVDQENVGSDNLKASILAIREEAGSVLAVAPGVGLRDFAFDRVFSDKTQQFSTYDSCAQRLVMDFLNGYNTSIICYGQTGSGKTHTMFGPQRISSPEDNGIVPRACQEILGSMRHRRSRGMQIELGLSYVEVFGGEVSDLLKEGKVVGQGQDGRYASVRATDRVGHRYVLDGHTECKVESWEEVNALLESGDRSKRLAATAMNERSTRAHTLLVLTLKQTTASGYEVQSRLFLADLGGSERLSKSKADAGIKAPVAMVGGVEVGRVGWQEYYARRSRIQETLNINGGLFCLKNVIQVLHRRSQMIQDGVPPHQLPYVPYQDSKLTMLLKDALGGNSRTLVFCTARMDPGNAVESLQTLRFAEQCAQVQQQGGKDTAAAIQAALRQIANEIREVEAEIVRKERWETQLVRREDVDTVGGAFGQGAEYMRTEVKTTSVLVGAEKEREQLELLLQRQADLQGLGGFNEVDYRDMKAKDAQDGGKGVDFRAKDRFGKKMKAKDFEQEVVLADALRSLFRQAAVAAEIFGEREELRRKRLAPRELHPNYFRLALWLRSSWQEAMAAGAAENSFGKTMLDRCQEWSAAFKAAPAARDQELEKLVTQADLRSPIPENIMADIREIVG